VGSGKWIYVPNGNSSNAYIFLDNNTYIQNSADVTNRMIDFSGSGYLKISGGHLTANSGTNPIIAAGASCNFVLMGVDFNYGGASANRYSTSGGDYWFQPTNGKVETNRFFTNVFANTDIQYGTTTVVSGRPFLLSARADNADRFFRFDAASGHVNGLEMVENGVTTLGKYWQIYKNSATDDNLAFWNNGEWLNISTTTFKISNTPQFSGTNTTGAGSAALGANCPAITLTAPYKWIQAKSSDGSTVYFPVWK
jgi:hypothetical protein